MPKSRKVFIALLLALMFGAYFYHIKNKQVVEIEQPNTALISKSLSSSNQDNVRQISEEKRAPKVTSQVNPDIDKSNRFDARWLDVSDVSSIRFTFMLAEQKGLKLFNLPDEFFQYLDINDVYTALSLLLNDLENPEVVIAIDGIANACKLLVSREKDKNESAAKQDDNYDEGINLAEANSEWQQKQQQDISQLNAIVRMNSEKASLFSQSCMDSLNAYKLAPEQLYAGLKNSTHPLAEIFNDEAVELDQIISIMRAYQKDSKSSRSSTILAQILINSEKPEDIEEGLQIFDKLNPIYPYSLDSLYECFLRKDKCASVRPDKNPLDYLLMLGEYGLDSGFEKIEGHFSAQQDHVNRFAYQQFRLALIKHSCVGDKSYIISNYNKAIKLIEDAESYLSEDELDTASEVAEELYMSHLDKAQSWLGC